MTNPVLVNDLRRSWFRRRPVHAVALMAILILVLTLFMPLAFSMLFGWSTYTAPLWRFPDVALPVIAPAFAAGSFAKEHELRTWPDILLTRLSAGQIVAGKFFSSFIPTVAMIVVLFPPFALILILSNVQWAQEPGFWMVAIALRFLVASIFYLAVSLVCSYHSSNARASLVVGYVVLALYGVISYAAWRWIIDALILPEILATPNLRGNFTSPMYGEVNGLTSISRHEFGFSAVDTIYMAQSLLLSFILFSYLLRRIRQRQCPNL